MTEETRRTSNTKTNRSNENKHHGDRTVFILIFLLVIIAIGYIAYYIWEAATTTEAFVAAKTHSVTIYTRNQDKELEEAGALVRGTAVLRSKFTITEDSSITYSMIRTSDRKSYYIPSDNLAASRDECVLEKEVFARTPVTIYRDKTGPYISSFAHKGTKLYVVGYDKLQSDGSIVMYKVSLNDPNPTAESGEEAEDPQETKEDNNAEGYVYSKYLTQDEEASLANYNENGEYDKAKKDVYSMNLYGGKAANLDFYPYEKTRIKDNIFPDNARTMYINAGAAINYKPYIKLIEKSNCNAVVIDIKDGPLTYKSDVAKEVSPTSYKKAHISMEDFKKSADAYKAEEVYLIGRIVVFNDSYYAKDHPEDCIKYEGKTSWPSVYSRAVWEYNVRLAIEAIEKFGFNEIQFDYVRFPESSYQMSKSGKANFRNTYKEEKGQAVQNFCFYAADCLRRAGAYISVDVFGESAYGYMTAYGQYWAGISNIVDAISGMPYTDHFAGESPWADPYKSVRKWAKRAEKQQKMVANPAAARTWITGYDTPYWNPTVAYEEEELDAQIKALEDSSLTGGFIPWHAGSSVDKYKSYLGIWKE